MAQLRGLCYTAKTDAATMHSLIGQLLAQTERWIVSLARVKRGVDEAP